MKCKKCGNELEEGAAFCQSCGSKVEDAEKTSEPAAEADKTVEAKVEETKAEEKKAEEAKAKQAQKDAEALEDLNKIRAKFNRPAVEA